MKRFNHSGEINLAKESKQKEIIFTYDIVGAPEFSNANGNFGTSVNITETYDKQIFDTVCLETKYFENNNTEKEYIVNDQIYLVYKDSDDTYASVFNNYQFIINVLYNAEYTRWIIYDPVMCRYKIVARKI